MREAKWMIITMVSFSVIMLVVFFVSSQAAQENRDTSAAEQTAAEVHEALNGQDETVGSSGEGEGTAVANPIVDYGSAAELASATGITLTAPTGAENLAYSAITFEGGQPPIAQVSYTLNGYDCCYRAEALEVYQDISGMNYDWSVEEAVEVGTVAWNVKIDADGTTGIALRLEDDGTMKSLSVQGTGVSVDVLTAEVTALQR